MLVRIGSVSELPRPGEAKEFSAGGKLVCVANVDGTLSAMDNVCQHRGGPLGQGVVMDGKVICPWHGWRWDPRTGIAMENRQLRAEIYAIKLEGDEVYIEIG